jgi:hypothetical protein
LCKADFLRPNLVLAGIYGRRPHRRRLIRNGYFPFVVYLPQLNKPEIPQSRQFELFCPRFLAFADADNPAMTLPTPALKFFADLSVQVAKPQEVGRTARGMR